MNRFTTCLLWLQEQSWSPKSQPGVAGRPQSGCVFCVQLGLRQTRAVFVTYTIIRSYWFMPPGGVLLWSSTIPGGINRNDDGRKYSLKMVSVAHYLVALTSMRMADSIVHKLCPCLPKAALNTIKSSRWRPPSRHPVDFLLFNSVCGIFSICFHFQRNL